MTISKRITIDFARYDNSVRGSASYNPNEVDRQNAWEISKLPPGAMLELRVHSYRPFRCPREYGSPGVFPDPHNWGRPDLHIVITADSYEVANEWEDLFQDQYSNTQQHKPAA
ncbi:hypothetical protein NicSoilE8_27250 [Arthrobacter sp. NicSoilE8]|nr:hypothetical protein NicSoilE8_27250 [Arthrobacter sp. NicSoilE8]